MSPERETDSLSNLEQRIQQAIDLVARLRAEKEAALEQAAAAKAEAARHAEEVRALHGERQQVRQRLEKLVAQIDHLSEQ
jgi:FtsZ-binding cell division protein ZapB